MPSGSQLVSYCIDRDNTIHSTVRTFNAAILHMHLFTSWKRRMAEKKVEMQAKARSDEIDLRLKEEAKSLRRLCNVLLMSSCSLISWSTSATIYVDLLGIPESEAAAFALVKRMKLVHGTYTHGELVEYRPVIWKFLLQNSRNIVMAIRSRNLGPIRHSNNVSCVFYIFHLLL